jgi:hypothetical protein
MEKEEKQKYLKIVDKMIKKNKVYCNKYDMSTNLNMTILGQDVYMLLSFENNIYLNISRFFHELRTLYRRNRVKQKIWDIKAEERKEI